MLASSAKQQKSISPQVSSTLADIIVPPVRDPPRTPPIFFGDGLEYPLTMLPRDLHTSTVNRKCHKIYTTSTHTFGTKGYREWLHHIPLPTSLQDLPHLFVLQPVYHHDGTSNPRDTIHVGINVEARQRSTLRQNPHATQDGTVQHHPWNSHIPRTYTERDVWKPICPSFCDK